MTRAIAPFVVASMLAISFAARSADSSADVPPTTVARDYARIAFDFVERHSVSRRTLDWPSLRSQFELRLRGARAPADTHPTIRWLLEQLGDGNHSQLRAPGSLPALLGTDTFVRAYVRVAGEDAFNAAGMVDVPSFAGSDALDVVTFAQTLYRSIVALAPKVNCGWIVDLRGNAGGNMWPMLAGVSPLLGSRTVGYFHDADGNRSPWETTPGAARLGEMVILARDDREGIDLSRTPVAVLIGPRTASSGEAVVVAFKGRARTRFFGDPTAGVSSANTGMKMPDGMVLLVTGAQFVDRTGRLYGMREGLWPDLPATSGMALEAEAQHWLRDECRQDTAPVK